MDRGRDVSRTDQWMPPNIGEYFAYTMQFTMEQHGAYLLLCMHKFMHGSVPSDDRELAIIARATVRKWRKIGEPVLALLSHPDGAPIPFVMRMWREHDGRLRAAEWRAVRAVVFERDDYTCGYCGSRPERLECDHIIPVARGGSNDLDNLRAACGPCNRRKHAKMPHQWMPS